MQHEPPLYHDIERYERARAARMNRDDLCSELSIDELAECARYHRDGQDDAA